MNLQSAFLDGASLFFIVLAFGIIVTLVERHENGGEFDWKGFGKWVFYGLFLGVAAFIASLVHHQ